ncbi:hypothetical protein CYMTET_23760 [Cymbomonas tetramitiformis]|uniref:Uncharacterized protein n=1 Tax=Cymbomonas tetramitiformis TaxID=36881 RepID=A0AAE0FXP9_9CHLO|nr:hypothetical protein CYMTET_23760 [Cymbomonas tetramitiformis]
MGIDDYRGKQRVRSFCVLALDDESAESMHALALMHILQAAADDGPDAFAAAVETHGPPAVLSASGPPGGIDVSAYGFTVGGAVGEDAADSAEKDVLQDLHELSDIKMDALGERARRQSSFPSSTAAHGQVDRTEGLYQTREHVSSA